MCLDFYNGSYPSCIDPQVTVVKDMKLKSKVQNFWTCPSTVPSIII